MEFSRELRNDVLAGDITLSVRLWKRPRVKQAGRYRVGLGEIEVDAIELVPFAAITRADVRRAGERDRETLRRRAAHAGPVHEDTLGISGNRGSGGGEDSRRYLELLAPSGAGLLHGRNDREWRELPRERPVRPSVQRRA